MAERQSALPPENGSKHVEPDFAYRIWQRGSKWYWEVILEGNTCSRQVWQRPA